MSKDIILLDGRVFTITAGIKNVIKSIEGNIFSFDLTWVNVDNDLSVRAFSVILDFFFTKSLSYCQNIVSSVGVLINRCSIEIDIIDISSILNKSNINFTYYINFIIPVLKKWNEYKLIGLSKELIHWLEDGHKFEEQGNGVYFTLITNDPERGALTIQELTNIHSVLNSAYQSMQIGQDDFTLAWFFIGTGVRPIQVSRLLKGDVRVNFAPEGNEVTIMVPLAKGEGVVNQGKWPRRAPSVLAECLINYLNLPQVRKLSDDERLFDMSPSEISKRIKLIFDKLDTWSERLESKIPIFPYRFRYTLATRAIEHGASDHEVARLLTHRKTSCIRYYRASMPMLIKPLRDHLGKEMEFFAKAFQGKLIDNLSEATRANDSNALLRDFLRLTGQAVGACGTKAECYQNAPISCLSCNHFEPFYNAPWEELLIKIQEDINSENEIRIKEIHLVSISAINEIIKSRNEHIVSNILMNGDEI